MKKIRKAVITAAGTGARLLPFTKESPKEMMPIFGRDNNELVIKPTLQTIYESLFDYGIKNYCMVVGRGKRAIEDHFLTSSRSKNLEEDAVMKSFFKKIEKSNIIYVQQSSPRGFGDAVSKSKIFAGSDNFLLHAGDDIILSADNNHLERLERTFFEYGAEMVFLATKVDDPRAYGVIQGTQVRNGVIKVENLEEKPRNPKSNIAVIAIYIFNSSIFDILKNIKPDKKGELQLADAVKIIIKNGNTYAVKLQKNERRIDVGTPESYVKSINESYQFFNKK